MIRSKLLLLVSIVGLHMHAQDLDYFLELNQPTAIGDARFTSMSSATVALSGSMTAIALNPALAGLYRQQGFSVNVGGLTRTMYDQDDLFLRGSTNRAVLPNFGWVSKDPESPMRLFFVYNTDNAYARKFKIQASDANSMQLPIIDYANGTPPEFLADNLGPYEDMLYQCYAVDWDPDKMEYVSTADLTSTDYTHNYFRKGMRNRITIGAAFQQSPQFYFGGSIQLVTSNEDVEIEHRETYNTYSDLNYFSSSEVWTNFSAGISGNLGIYYRPVQFLRLGAVLELPQIHGFNLDWETTFSATRPSVSSSAMTAQGYGTEYSWGVITAPKLQTGATIVVGRAGLITAGHTFIPHSWTMSTGRNERYLAEIIDSTTSNQHLFALGTEWRLGPLILRGGGLFSPAYREGQQAAVGYSLGLAIRSDQTTVEFGWQRRIQRSQYYPFSKDYSDPFLYQMQEAILVVGVAWKI